MNLVKEGFGRIWSVENCDLRAGFPNGRAVFESRYGIPLEEWKRKAVKGESEGDCVEWRGKIKRAGIAVEAVYIFHCDGEEIWQKPPGEKVKIQELYAIDTRPKKAQPERNSKKMIFMGNGAESELACYRLEKELREALDLLSGLQQQPRPGTDDQEPNDEEGWAELDRIARRIYISLTGKKPR